MGRGGDNVARFVEHREAILKALSGYATAAALVERERATRLARMSPEEARATYSDLCRSQAGLRDTRDAEQVGRRRLAVLLAVRQVMVRLAGGTGDDE